jgi:hypothetical protein
MTQIQKIVMYELGIDGKDNLTNQSMLEQAYDPSKDVLGNVKALVQADSPTNNPIKSNKHDHIEKSRIPFSIVLEKGKCLYVVELDNVLGIKFGPNALPVCSSVSYLTGILADQCLIDRELKGATTSPAGYNDQLNYKYLCFSFDRDAFSQRAHEAEHAAIAATQGSNGHARVHATTWAIPFDYDLYHQGINVPIWMFNDHPHKEKDDGFGMLFHGGPHPGSGGGNLLIS